MMGRNSLIPPEQQSLIDRACNDLRAAFEETSLAKFRAARLSGAVKDVVQAILNDWVNTLAEKVARDDPVEIERFDDESPTHIKLTPAERQSSYSRQHWAEALISQLPDDHDGRNSWLLNYGVGNESCRMRERRGLYFDHEFNAVIEIR
jgi:hypothetical protein